MLPTAALKPTAPPPSPLPYASLPSAHHHHARPYARPRTISLSSASSPALSLSPLPPHSAPPSAVESPEPDPSAVGFVEVGSVTKAHGLNGRVHLLSFTGFPMLRFGTPGTRWLRSVVLGKEHIRQVELLSGKEAHKNCWIVSFKGIDTVEKAREIVGSTVLVREDDRPPLSEGAFYTNDLIGMKVLLKETGTLVGTVVNVVKYENNAGDLLQVKLDTSEGILKVCGSPELEKGAHGARVWIPFVEAIVPDVDLEKREMQITPPKGLIQLNLRSDPRSKKERSKAEWKERVKFRRHLTAAKKKLLAMGQKHVLEGFSYGEKDKNAKLAHQIVDIDYKLFQHALNNTSTSQRFNLFKYLESVSVSNSSTKFPQKNLTSFPSDEKGSKYFKLLTTGIDLVCKNKICTFLVVGEIDNHVHEIPLAEASSGKPDQLCRMQELLNDDSFLKVDGLRVSASLVIVSPSNDIDDYQQLFLKNDYFGFDVEKVRFLKEPTLPIIANDNTNKILLKSPWEILQSPVGSGGIFSMISASSIMNEIRDWGVDYVQVSRLTSMSVAGHLMLLGLVKSKGSDVGFRIPSSKSLETEDAFDVVLSTKFLDRMVKNPGKIELYPVAAQCDHVECVNGKWEEIVPNESNCVRIRSSIYSLLDKCPPEKLCILMPSED